jgi:hypothetical protein
MKITTTNNDVVISSITKNYSYAIIVDKSGEIFIDISHNSACLSHVHSIAVATADELENMGKQFIKLAKKIKQENKK